MNQETISRPASRRRKWIIVTTVVVLGLFFVAGVVLHVSWSKGVLEKGREEADRLDPGWRWEDLAAGQPKISEEENSYRQVSVVENLLSSRQEALGQLEKVFEEVGGSDDFLSEDKEKEIAPLLEKLQPAVDAARKLADMPRGQAPLSLTLGLSENQSTRKVSGFLKIDALVQAKRKNLDGALRSCQGIINTARSLGDGLLICFLVRVACVSHALTAMEKVLAHGEAAETVLKGLQESLEEEEKYNRVLLSSRWERAFIDTEIQAMLDGKPSSFGPPPSSTSPASGLRRLMNIVVFSNIASRHYGLAIPHMNRAVEIAKMPEVNQEMEWKALDANRKVGRLLVSDTLIPALEKVVQADKKIRGALRCAIVMVAMERYRKARGRWPDSLEALVPQFLAKVPVTPYDGKSLIYEIQTNGVVISAGGPKATMTKFLLKNLSERAKVGDNRSPGKSEPHQGSQQQK